MLQQFLAQNIHFAISLFAALACFAVFWLIFDAWSLRKEWKELTKWVGFLLLAISFLLYAAIVEQAGYGQNAWADKLELGSWVCRLLGYIAVIIGQVIDPLQFQPKAQGIDLKALDTPAKDAVIIPNRQAITTANPNEIKKPSIINAAFSTGLIVKAALPASAMIAGLLYWRRSHKGLERHLKPLSWVFLGFAGYELTWLITLHWRQTTNPILYDWSSLFSYVWFGNHLLLLISAAVLGKWVWRYLVKRLQSQLFMIFTSLTVGICLITTISFTYLLMRNVETQSFENLRTAGLVLDYALTSKKAETRANAEVIADNSEITKAVVASDRGRIGELTDNYLAEKELTSFVITDADGLILYRGEDPERWGQSLSDDALVRRALLGGESAGVVSREGVIAPEMAIQAAIPIRADDLTIIGVVRAERTIDNAFADGIKAATGLDSSVYASDVRASTTFVAPDGQSRWVGVKETNTQVVRQVLEGGESYSGLLSILNRSYLAVYQPLKDVDDTVVGMLFVGQSQVNFLQTIAKSVELTFVIIAALIIFLTLPAFLIARRLTRQLE